MKKLLLAAAALGTLFTGCVDNEPEVGPSTGVDRKIAFAAPLVSAATRVMTGEITNPYPADESFVVYAMKHSGSFSQWNGTSLFMNGVVCSKSNDNNYWAPENNYYWPKNDNLTFYAYSPANNNIGWIPVMSYTDSKNKLSCENVDLSAGNIDLLYSQLAADKKANDVVSGNNGTSEYTGVELKFQHALSSIKFKVRLDAEYNDATIKVKKITLKGIDSKGNFSWNASVPTETAAAPTWTAVASNIKDYNALTNNDGYQVTTTATDPGASALLLLPQDFTDNKEIEVVYNVSQTSSSNSYDETAVVRLNNLIYTENGSATDAKWKPGRRYTYTIVFGLDKIYFDPAVTDFIDVTVSGGATEGGE